MKYYVNFCTDESIFFVGEEIKAVRALVGIIQAGFLTCYLVLSHVLLFYFYLTSHVIRNYCLTVIVIILAVM